MAANGSLVGKRRDGVWLVALLAVIAVSGYWWRPRPEATPSPTPPSPAPAASVPAKATPVASVAAETEPLCGPPSDTLRTLRGVQAPKLTKKVKVVFETDLGAFELEVYPEAAPSHAKRFLELVEAGFYDGTPVFRVVPSFVIQFGLNSAFPTYREMRDEPSRFCTDRGTLCFAKAATLDSATTQVFICLSEVTQNLVPEPGKAGVGIFTAFGRVVKGMDVVEKCKVVGDPQMGLDQGRLTEDTQGYLKSLKDKPSMILRARVVR